MVVSNKKRITKRNLAWLMIGLILLVLPLSGFFWVQDSGLAVAESQTSAGMNLTTAPLILRSSGEIAFNDLRLGTRVKAGQILVATDSGDTLSQLEQVQGRIRELNADLVSINTRTRENDLFFHQQAEKLNSCFQRRAGLNKELHLARQKERELLSALERCRLRAPFDGIVGVLTECEIGSQVEAGFKVGILVADPGDDLI